MAANSTLSFCWDAESARMTSSSVARHASLTGPSLIEQTIEHDEMLANGHLSSVTGANDFTIANPSPT
jgi:hypothetical protein